MIPVPFPFSLPLWPVQRLDGLWGMGNGDYCMSHWVVTPVAVAAPDMVSLARQLSTALGM